MGDQINTRFGALDSRLAAAVRHTLDVAVTFTALAPMNDVHLRLIAMARIVSADCAFPDPPSHKWHELMVELFGRNSVGLRRSPVSSAQRQNPAVLADIKFARSYEPNATERQIVHNIVAASGAFLIAESIAMSDVVRSWSISGRETFVGDSLISDLLRAGQTGMALTENAAAGTWWRLLSYQNRRSPAVDRPRIRVAAASDREEVGPPLTAAGTGGTPATYPPAAGPGSEPQAPSARRTKRGSIATVAVGFLLVVVLAAALGLLALNQTGKLTASGLERPDLTLSIMTTTDLGPFWLAVENGYFKEAGFTFDADDVTRAKSGTESARKLAANEVDIAYATYAPFFVGQSRGADIKLVAGASSAGPGSCMVVAMPNSKITSVGDMAGARVAITARGTISELMVQSALKANGVDYTTIEWVEVPFEEMAGKLALGEVDAAFMTEPFLSQAQKTYHTVALFDTAVGQTENLPTAGFGANATFVRKYPKTVAAFQKVMQRATDEALSDRTNVEPMLVQFAKVDASTAKLPTLLTFQSSVDSTQLQRVADLMQEFGMIREAVDVSRMIFKAPARR